MKFCTRCGNDLTDSKEIFCQNCGTQIEAKIAELNMRKYSIKISLIYCVVFFALGTLLQLLLILGRYPWTFVGIANAAWLFIVIKASNKIKRESIKTKLCFYVVLFIVQMIFNMLIKFVPLFENLVSIVLILCGEMAMGITVLIVIFVIAKSIQSRRFYMLALKYCLYIFFSLGILVFIAVMSEASINLPI